MCVFENLGVKFWSLINRSIGGSGTNFRSWETRRARSLGEIKGEDEAWNVEVRVVFRMADAVIQLRL